MEKNSDNTGDNSKGRFWKKLFLGIFILLAGAAILVGVIYGLSTWDFAIFGTTMVQVGDALIIAVLALSLFIIASVLITGVAFGIILFTLGLLAVGWVLASLIFFPILFPVFLPIIIISLLIALLMRRKKT